jgi:hypothetical protein
MQGRWIFVVTACVLGGSFACGAKKEPKDPSDTPPASADEGAPKWEGASTTRSSSSSSGGSSSSSTDDSKPTTASQASSGGAVQETSKPKTGQYDKEGAEIALKRAARQVKANCGQAKDDSGKAIGPWGKVTVQVQLGHNGHSKGTTVPAPYQGKPVGNCIEKAFTNLQFPPWSGDDTQVDWDVELIEPGKEAKK